MGQIDDGSAPGWRTTQIVYPSPTARRALLDESLRALDATAVGPWFWVDLGRATGEGEVGVLEVAIATGDGVVPTQWFRDAVGRGLIEQAAAVERSRALEPGLFPHRRVPAAYAELLAATSRHALLLLRGDDAEIGRSWAVVRDEIAAIYAALVPEPAARRAALLEYAQWLERTVAPAGWEPGRGLAIRVVPDSRAAAQYEELGGRLRAELDHQDLVVSAGRLAHTQVLRLQPDGVNGARQEVRIARDLADRAGVRSGATGSSPTPPPTVFDHAVRQLALVAEAVGVRSADPGAPLLRAMASRCGDRDAAELPRWSCLGDDCSPFEISLTTSRAGHQVRLLVEAQSDPASPEGYWDAGCELTRWLAGELGLDQRRLDAVGDLFGPATPEAFWAIWHGVDLGDEPLVKVYLNPRLGVRSPDLVVRDLLMRLGFESAWAAVEAAAAGGATPSHVSLDLGGESRVKVYLRHVGEAAGSLVAVPRQVSTTAAGDFAAVCAVLGGDDSLAGARPPFTTLYFADPEAGTPERVALHLPVQSYVPDDTIASSRIRSLLQAFALDTDGYERAFAALAAESLLTRGLNSYVGFQRDQSGPRITTYFGARLYAERHGWPARAPSRVWPTPLAPR